MYKRYKAVIGNNLLPIVGYPVAALLGAVSMRYLIPGTTWDEALWTGLIFLMGWLIAGLGLIAIRRIM